MKLKKNTSSPPLVLLLTASLVSLFSSLGFSQDAPPKQDTSNRGDPINLPDQEAVNQEGLGQATGMGAAVGLGAGSVALGGIAAALGSAGLGYVAWEKGKEKKGIDKQEKEKEIEERRDLVSTFHDHDNLPTSDEKADKTLNKHRDFHKKEKEKQEKREQEQQRKGVYLASLEGENEKGKEKEVGEDSKVLMDTSGKPNSHGDIPMETVFVKKEEAAKEEDSKVLKRRSNSSKRDSRGYIPTESVSVKEEKEKEKEIEIEVRPASSFVQDLTPTPEKAKPTAEEKQKEEKRLQKLHNRGFNNLKKEPVSLEEERVEVRPASLGGEKAKRTVEEIINSQNDLILRTQLKALDQRLKDKKKDKKIENLLARSLKTISVQTEFFGPRPSLEDFKKGTEQVIVAHGRSPKKILPQSMKAIKGKGGTK
jgi:hypothetical protein